MRLDQLLLEERTLNRREGNLTRNKPLLRRRCRTHGSCNSRELGDGLVTKDEFGRKFKSCLSGAGNDLDREYRVAAKFEEAVVNTDLGDAEHFLPNLRQLLFDRVARRC